MYTNYVFDSNLGKRNDMGKFLIILIFAVIPFFAHAECRDFLDENTRYLCFASVNKDISYCENISDNDVKYYCKARIGKDKAYCKLINNKKFRKHCLNIFKK